MALQVSFKLNADTFYKYPLFNDQLSIVQNANRLDFLTLSPTDNITKY